MINSHTLRTACAVFVLAAAACSTETAGPESTNSVAQAQTSAGVGATLTVSPSGSSYTATMVVTNGSAEAISNWQVLVNMAHSSIAVQWLQPAGAAGVTGAFVNDLGANTLFMPTSSTANIAAGQSQTLTWSGTYAGTVPSIVSVDGMASGTAYAGNAADGIDPVALTAATAAFKIATDYETGKLANNGDSLYSIYDQTIWSAQTFRVASGNATIEFDPNAPGYAFVPNSVKIDLAVAQLDASVASYLTSGLVSCFGATDATKVYAFRADFLKGFAYAHSNSGSVTNSDGSVDNFTASGAAKSHGQEVVTITASSGPTKADPSFGIFRYLNAAWNGSGPTFPTYKTAVQPKFHGSAANVGSNPSSWPGHYAAACSPFNGPGGSSNPYFILSQSINGVSQNMSAWFQGLGSQGCNNGCNGTFSVDPIAYTVPGNYYDVNSNLVGPQVNPFSLIVTNQYADPSHAGQWASRTVAGVQQWGTFSNPVNVLGGTVYQYIKQM